MRRNGEWLLAVCLAVLPALTIPGCGGDSTTETPSPASGDATAGSPPANGAAAAVSDDDTAAAPAAPAADTQPAAGTQPVADGAPAAPVVTQPPAMDLSRLGRKKSDEDGDGSSPVVSPAPPAAGGPNSEAAGAAAPVTPARPESVDAWTDADFESAVRDRDEKVLSAITAKVQKLPGDSAVAKLLVQLIAVSLETPPEQAATAATAPSPAQQRDDPDDPKSDSPKKDDDRRGMRLQVPVANQVSKTILPLNLHAFMEQIVGGLIANNTADAWQAVNGILTQQVRTPLNDDEICSVVMYSMLEQLETSEALTGPKLRTLFDGSVALPPETQTRLLKIVTAVSAAATDALFGLKPESATATGVAAPPVPVRANIGRMRDRDDDDGVSVAPVPSSTAAPADDLPVVDLDEEAIRRAAAFFWSTAMRERFVSRLHESKDGPTTMDLLRLCATIPHTDARKEIYRVFTDSFEAGTGAWATSGIFQAGAHDPGMLVILKSLPRTRPSTKSKSDLQLMDTWTQASGECVLALRDKLKMAATKLPRYDGPSYLRLHKGAVPENSVLIQLPGNLSETMGDSSPAVTNVFYTQVPFSPSSAREQGQVADHYEEKSGGKRRVDEKRGILWFDGVKSQSEGLRRSVDVIIQKSSAVGVPVVNSRNADDDGFSGGGGGALGGFLIEIIVVETADLKELPVSEADPKADSESDAPPK